MTVRLFGLEQSRLHRGCIALMVALATGCTLPRTPRTLNETDPTGKIPAIKTTVLDPDRESVAQLVDELDSDDAAIRFYAFGALHKITGETFGYQYYDDELERRPALDAWREWLNGLQSAGAPTTAASD